MENANAPLQGGVGVEPDTVANKYDRPYMEMARIWGQMSYCSRKQVGSLIVKDGTIISDGYNGTPSKSKPNICEGEDGKTHWWVLHSEANAILKCAKHGKSCDGATLYVTLMPCRDCSKLILQAGIARVVYGEDYGNGEGVAMLRECGVQVEGPFFNR